MHVANPKDVSKEGYTSPLFTGSDVTRQAVAPGSQDYNVNLINFGKGVRNKLHTHESDQIRKVNVGDVILIPAGERYWHGAGQDSEFSHIALTKAGSKLTQLED